MPLERGMLAEAKRILKNFKGKTVSELPGNFINIVNTSGAKFKVPTRDITERLYKLDEFLVNRGIKDLNRHIIKTKDILYLLSGKE